MESICSCLTKEKHSAPEIKPKKQKRLLDIPDEILKEMKEKKSRPEIKQEEQKCILDIPDEILEDSLLTLLSFRDLMNVMNIGNERLYNCANKIIKKKPLFASDLKEEWFKNAREGNLDNMKNIYKIMKEKGKEEYIKEWRYLDVSTILLEASYSGKEDILRWLLHELKFDVNEQNRYGYTALHFAAYYNQMKCARLLLDVGSQHLKDHVHGQTPLHYAKRNGYKKIQRLIESHFQLN